MSRRSHHGRNHGTRGPRAENARPANPVRRAMPGPEQRSPAPDGAAARTEPESRVDGPAVSADRVIPSPVADRGEPLAPVSGNGPAEAAPAPFRAAGPSSSAGSAHPHAVPPPTAAPAPEPAPASHPINGGREGYAELNAGCTAPQLRRFIKSRTYVPMHELRRRFGINGGEDDVTPVDLEGSWIYVGLPSREGRLLGELLRGGEVGYELSLDPRTPVVVGVYPMRPVPRH